MHSSYFFGNLSFLSFMNIKFSKKIIPNIIFTLILYGFCGFLFISCRNTSYQPGMEASSATQLHQNVLPSLVGIWRDLETGHLLRVYKKINLNDSKNNEDLYLQAPEILSDLLPNTAPLKPIKISEFNSLLKIKWFSDSNKSAIQKAHLIINNQDDHPHLIEKVDYLELWNQFLFQAHQTSIKYLNNIAKTGSINCKLLDPVDDMSFLIINHHYNCIQSLILNVPTGTRLQNLKNEWLFLAIDQKNEFLIKLFLQNGASISALDENNLSPLQKLINQSLRDFSEDSSLDIIPETIWLDPRPSAEVLINQGTNFNEIDPSGVSPFHNLIYKSHLNWSQLIYKMIQLGAEFRGRSPKFEAFYPLFFKDSFVKFGSYEKDIFQAFLNSEVEKDFKFEKTKDRLTSFALLYSNPEILTEIHKLNWFKNKNIHLIEANMNKKITELDLFLRMEMKSVIQDKAPERIEKILSGINRIEANLKWLSMMSL